MAYINYQNLPSTTTPVNATNLNSMQDGLARVIYSEGLTNSATKTYTLPNSSAVYLIIVHTNSNNRCLFEVVYGNGNYHTTIMSNDYVTTTYSSGSVTIATSFTNRVRIIELS